MSRLDWLEQAACRDMDTNLFFFEPGNNHAAVAARKICGRCPVKEDCLQYAIDLHMTDGMFGGTTERERRQVRRERARRSECVWCGQMFSWFRKSGGSDPLTCSPECRYRRRRYMQNRSYADRQRGAGHARNPHSYEPQPEFRLTSRAELS